MSTKMYILFLKNNTPHIVYKHNIIFSISIYFLYFFPKISCNCLYSILLKL